MHSTNFGLVKIGLSGIKRPCGNPQSTTTLFFLSDLDKMAPKWEYSIGDMYLDFTPQWKLIIFERIFKNLIKEGIWNW